MSDQEITHIYMAHDQNLKKIVKESSSYEKYIILQNTTLQKENVQLKLRVSELESQAEEMEHDNDRSDTRANNMKGLLKNFHEMNNMRSSLHSALAFLFRTSELSLEAFRYKATCHLRVLEAFLVCFLGLFAEYGSIMEFSAVLFCLMIVVAFQESTLRNIPRLTHEATEKRITQLLEDIKEVEKGQDYIHEFLDQQ